MGNERRVLHHEQGPHALLGHRREGAVESLGPACLQKLQLHAQRPRRVLDVSYGERSGRTVRVGEDGHTADPGGDFLEQFQIFAEDIRADAVGHPSDVSARARQARDEPELHGMGKTYCDDGDCPGGLLRCPGSRRRRRYDDVHLEADQLFREIGQAVESALPPPIDTR